MEVLIRGGAQMDGWIMPGQMQGRQKGQEQVDTARHSQVAALLGLFWKEISKT